MRPTAPRCAVPGCPCTCVFRAAWAAGGPCQQSERHQPEKGRQPPAPRPGEGGGGWPHGGLPRSPPGGKWARQALVHPRTWTGGQKGGRLEECGVPTLPSPPLPLSSNGNPPKQELLRMPLASWSAEAMRSQFQTPGLDSSPHRALPGRPAPTAPALRLPCGHRARRAGEGLPRPPLAT